jgi:hypothetical protein
MNPGQSMRAALLSFALVVLAAFLLSLGGCAFEVHRTADGYRASAGLVVWSLIALLILCTALEARGRRK